MGLKTRCIIIIFFLLAAVLSLGKVSLNLTRNVDVFWPQLAGIGRIKVDKRFDLEGASNMQMTLWLTFLIQILTHVIVAATLRSCSLTS